MMCTRYPRGRRFWLARVRVPSRSREKVKRGRYGCGCRFETRNHRKNRLLSPHWISPPLCVCVSSIPCPTGRRATILRANPSRAVEYWNVRPGSGDSFGLFDLHAGIWGRCFREEVKKVKGSEMAYRKVSPIVYESGMAGWPSVN